MLLAKSPYKDGRQKGLAEHCSEVMDSFEHLFGTIDKPSRLGQEWLRFFKLAPDDYTRFYVNGVSACGLHDLGKANEGFQSAVTGGRLEQVMRHEHLSALILILPSFQQWLLRIPFIDVDIVLSAVGGHHLKASPKKEKYYPVIGEKLGDVPDMFKVLSSATDFQQVLDQVSQRLNIEACEIHVEKLWSYKSGYGQDIYELSKELIKHLTHCNRTIEDDKKRGALLRAVKAAVIAADAAGSGLVREKNHNIKCWISEAFSESKLLDGDRIGNDVIEKRIAEILHAGNNRTIGKSFTWGDFQLAAGNLPERALMLAACGSGKTLAAWKWIEARLTERPRQRVIFLYPTRATATEGFRDYVAHAPESDAALVTGTSSYELQGMFTNPEDSRYNQTYQDETEARLFALAYWRRKIFSATVDQFLGFMQQSYRSICLLPVLADSVVVFDEVHSFDKGLFSSLKKFLEFFDIPVLCMTASLPSRRRAELEKLGLRTYP